MSFCEAEASNLLTKIKLSKSQLSAIIEWGEFLGRLLGPLIKVGLPLLKNVLTPLAKSVLIPLRVTAAEWLACRNAVIHEKILSIRSTLLEMSNK